MLDQRGGRPINVAPATEDICPAIDDTSMTSNPLQDFSPLRILIVEDEPMLAEMAADHYRDLGHEVEVAANGKDALACIVRRRPDIVFCDRRMPEMSGAELLENVRARGEEWAQVVFVFATGLNDRRDRYAMLPLKPDAYFCKPIDFEAADRTLAEILRKRRGAEG